MKHNKSRSSSARSIIIAMFIIMVAMVTQSMNAGDNTEEAAILANNIQTVTFNQFNTASHYRNW